MLYKHKKKNHAKLSRAKKSLRAKVALCAKLTICAKGTLCAKVMPCYSDPFPFLGHQYSFIKPKKLLDLFISCIKITIPRV